MGNCNRHHLHSSSHRYARKLRVWFGNKSLRVLARSGTNMQGGVLERCSLQLQRGMEVSIP